MNNFYDEQFLTDLFNIGIDVDYGINLINDGKSIITEQCDPKRHYHNWDHVLEVIKVIDSYDISQYNYKILIITALYHDAVYDPFRTDNEELSAELINDLLLSEQDKQLIKDLILFTKYQTPVQSELEQLFMQADLSIFSKSPSIQLDFEKKIMKEYQYVPLEIYVEKRIEILKSLQNRYQVNTTFLVDYLQNKVWNVGVYAGSFYPLTVGHLQVLKKAEKIFDKVIILSPSIKNCELKTGFVWDKSYGRLNTILELYEVHEITWLITEKLKDFPYKVTLVRGLRNSSDLLYEQNYIQVLRDIDKDINVIHILTDPEYAHISSSMVRGLLKIDPTLARKYIPYE